MILALCWWLWWQEQVHCVLTLLHHWLQQLTSSRNSYCSMILLSLAASSMFSCRSLRLCSRCCSSWFSISFSVTWKCSMASFRCSSYSRELRVFSSYQRRKIKWLCSQYSKNSYYCTWNSTFSIQLLPKSLLNDATLLGPKSQYILWLHEPWLNPNVPIKT